MKFSEMPYARPDLDAIKQDLAAVTEELRNAPDYAAAKAAFLKKQTMEKHVNTLGTLVSIRHSIDTRDAFYDEEQQFWNNAGPEIQEVDQKWTEAMLESLFRPQFAKEYGDIMFLNAEIAMKAFSPEIVAELQQENELTQEYGKLLASAKIPFEGGVYTIAQMGPFKLDADDARRLAAWKAEGAWYKENQEKLDEIYDKLVHLRDAMGKKMGYEGTPPLATTAWAETAIPRTMWKSSAPPCRNIWCRWRMESTGRRQSGLGRNIP